MAGNGGVSCNQVQMQVWLGLPEHLLSTASWFLFYIYHYWEVFFSFFTSCCFFVRFTCLARGEIVLPFVGHISFLSFV